MEVSESQKGGLSGLLAVLLSCVLWVGFSVLAGIALGVAWWAFLVGWDLVQ